MKRIWFLISLLMFIGSTTDLFAGTEESDRLVIEAWEAWNQNDQALVEEKFLAAIAADSMNTRAYLGLSMLYDFQYNYDSAWMTFRHILRTEEDAYPYLFAAGITPKMLTNYDLSNGGIVELLETIRKDPHARGIMRVGANELLGDYYQRKGQLDRAKSYYRDMGVIKAWTLIGPFDNLSASGFDRTFPPETAYEANAVYEGKNGIPVQWFGIDEYDNYFWINFRYHFPHIQSVFYANTFVYSPEMQTIQLRIGTSGALKAFLNDELMIAYRDENNNDLDTYIVETTLQEGWNRLLIKCGFSEILHCNFAVRITDTHGVLLEDLRYSTTPRLYPGGPGAPVTLIENFAEAFFKRQIETHPDDLENYIVLADTYLRNDKAVEAELVLRKAIGRAPSCALFYQHIIEAYVRGEKYDEIMTTMEKLTDLDELIPSVLEFMIDRHLENENFDAAETLIAKAAALQPESEWVYRLYLSLYGRKKQLDKVSEICRQAYERYPTNQAFVSMEAFLAIQAYRQFDRAVEVVTRYLQDQYDEHGLTVLASIYLQQSDVDNWRTTCKKIIELKPMVTGYYERMATTSMMMQDYAGAEDLFKKTLKICPYNSVSWEKLGDVYRATGQTQKARDAYHNALKYQPTHYTARRVLRELDGKPSIFSHFDRADPYSLIKSAPGAEVYPNDDAIILLQDLQRVVYERGASEYAKEFLIKVLNTQGIDHFHEHQISYNPNTEHLTIEKAVTIKQNGSEIAADENEGYLVFKSLEPGDCIYLKYRVANYYDGKLSNHFWDTFHFNLFFPQRIVRYALLVPEDFRFRHRTQNMPDEPTIRQTTDGVLYVWQLENEPGVEYEEDMPVLDDVGKVLYLSSIEDWAFMTAWYQDLAQAKTRSSYEIREQVARLFDGKEGLADAEKTGIVYDFITNNIRYSNVSFRQSGLIPQKARDVLVNRIGDCKDLTTLGIAMLHEIGVTAHYVLVNTIDNGYNRHILPSIAFNHCIAAVEMDNGLIYLDFTANNHPVGSLPYMTMGGFSLLIKPGVTKPLYLDRKGFMPNNIYRETTAEISMQNRLTAHDAEIRTGYMGASIRNRYQHIGWMEQKKVLTESLSNDYPNVCLNRFEVDELDRLAPEVRYRYSFEVPAYMTDAGPFKLFSLPWSYRLKTEESLSYETRRFPIFAWTAMDTTSEAVSLTLPPGYEPVDLPPAEIRLSCPMADYTVRYAFLDGVLTARRMLTVKETNVTPADYAAFKEFYNAVVKEDGRHIVLRKQL